MSNPFQKASRSQVFLKLAITGVTGSGKTLSALRLAKGLLKPGQRIAFIDTENDSASLYADLTEKQCRAMKIPDSEIEELMETSRLFDVLPVAPPFLPEAFSDGMKAAVAAEYGAAVIDSASHLWKGTLAYKAQIDERGGNQWTNWKDPDKKFQDALDSVLQSKIHAVFCMRSKMEYVIEENAKGKQAPRKVGMAPIMKDGIDYEFTTVFDVAMNHEAVGSKDRSGMFPTDRYVKVTEATGREFGEWLKTATPKPEPIPEKVPDTDDEKKAWFTTRMRESFAKAKTGDDEGLEILFVDKATPLCEDNRARRKLEEFSIDELRAIWPKFKLLLADVLKNAGVPQP